MNTGSRGKSLLLIATIAAAIFPPATSMAAGPKVRCLQAYATVVPPKCDPSDLTQAPTTDKVTPISDLFGLGAPFMGNIVVEGNATPGSTVTITISDGQATLTREAVTAATASENNATRAGDFEVVFDPTSDLSKPLSVQELGVHRARPGAPNSSTDPFDLGRSVLTVEAVASDGVAQSPTKTVEIVKLAATPGDTFAPEFRNLRFPPEHWCHWAGEGGHLFGENLGGGNDGSCGSLAYQGLGAVPDATWVLCMRETSMPPAQAPELFEDAQRSAIDAHDMACDRAGDCQGLDCESQYGCDPLCDEACAAGYADEWHQVRNNYCRTTPERSHPTQTAPVAGTAVDLHDAANGLASEISTVRITITQAGRVIRSYEDHFARATSTSGGWGFSLSINDFAPSWPYDAPYLVTVVAEDAWGNQATAQSQPINVYPY